jgi:hypothetical protein
MWPGKPVPVPPVTVGKVRRLRDSVVLFQYGPGEKHVKLPDELYVRALRKLDLGDAEAVIDFCERYGRLGGTEPRWHQLPVSVEDQFKPQLWPVIESAEARLRAFAEEYRALGNENDLATVEELAIHAAVVRDLTRLWQALTGSMAYDEVCGSWENPLFDPPPPDERLMLLRLAYDLNAALQPFHVRAEVVRDKDKQVVWAPPQRSLYAALCLQLANHISEGAIYRRCQHCNDLFYRQVGRAKFDQHRTKGRLFYCTDECANAEAQKGTRKRQSDALELSRSGIDDAEEIARRVGARLDAVQRWISKDSRRKDRP